MLNNNKSLFSYSKTGKYGLIFFLVLILSAPSSRIQAEERIGIQQPGYILDLAFYYFFSDDYVRSLQYFETYIKIKGEDDVALRYIGKIYLYMDRLDKSIEYLERSRSADPKNEETLYLLGQAYLTDNRIEEGAKTFEALAELSPGDVNTLYVLSQIYHQLNDRRKEMVYYRKLSSALMERGGFNPYLYKAFINLAGYHYGKSEYEESLHYYEEIHRINPRDYKTSYVLGELYKINGLLHKSAEVHKELVKRNPEDVRVLKSLVETLYILDDVQAAYYFGLLENASRRMDTFFKGIGAQIKGDNEAAIGYFDRAYRKNKTRLSLHIGRFRAYSDDKLKEKKEAGLTAIVISQQIQALEVSRSLAADLYKVLKKESVELDFTQRFFFTEKSPATYDENIANLAYHYIEFFTFHALTQEYAQRPKAALSYYLQALQYINTLSEWVEAAKGGEKLDEASYEKKAEDLRQRKSSVLIACGWITATGYKESRFDSVTLLKQGKNVNPKDFRSYYFLGMVYQDRAEENDRNPADYETAKGYFNEALKVYKESAEGQEAPAFLYFYLGMVSEKLGDMEEMESNVLKAIELDPYNPMYLNYMAYMYSQQNKNLDKAYEYVKTALEESPDEEALLDTLGWILYKMEKYEEALGQLLFAKSQADEKDVKDAIINFHIAETYFKLKNYPMAKFYYQKTLELKEYASEPLDEFYIKEQINKIKSMYNKKGN